MGLMENDTREYKSYFPLEQYKPNVDDQNKFIQECGCITITDIQEFNNDRDFFSAITTRIYINAYQCKQHYKPTK